MHWKHTSQEIHYIRKNANITNAVLVVDAIIEWRYAGANQEIYREHGYEEEAERIQELYLSGRKSEAEAAIPDSYLEATSLIGDEAFVKDRLQVYKDCGVTSLNVGFLGTTSDERVKNCEALKNLMEKHNI